MTAGFESKNGGHRPPLQWIYGFLQLRYSVSQRIHIALGLFRRGAAGGQPVTKLLIGDLAEIPQQPFHIGDGDVIGQCRTVFARKAPSDAAVLHFLDKSWRLLRKSFAIRSRSGDEITPFSERAAPVDDSVEIPAAAALVGYEDSQ